MDEASTLYAKLLGETAVIRWAELQPFFARGALLQVAAQADLVQVAVAVAEDDSMRIGGWLGDGTLAKVSEPQAMQWVNEDPTLWAVVVAPWVLVQQREATEAAH